jgi:hypothetical protein
MASEAITAMPEFSLHFPAKVTQRRFARRIRTHIAFSDHAYAVTAPTAADF